jgi:hypothetical protein
MRDIRNILEQLEDKRQFSFELSSRPQPMPNGGSKERPERKNAFRLIFRQLRG